MRAINTITTRFLKRRKIANSFVNALHFSVAVSSEPNGFSEMLGITRWEEDASCDEWVIYRTLSNIINNRWRHEAEYTLITNIISDYVWWSDMKIPDSPKNILNIIAVNRNKTKSKNIISIRVPPHGMEREHFFFSECMSHMIHTFLSKTEEII